MTGTRISSRRVALLVVGLIAVNGRRGYADDVTAARDHYVKGTKDFELGLYSDAVVEYMAAYQLRDDPALLYNIAQAHRLAGNVTEALRFYKVFIHKVPDAPNRQEVETRIEELQKASERENAAKTTQQGTVHSSGSGAVKGAEPAVGVAPVAASNETRRVPSRRLLILGSVTAGAGVLIVGAGIVLGVLAQNAGNSISALNAKGGTFDPSLETTGKHDQIASAVLIGVGAAAVVGGAVTLGLAVRHHSDSTKRAAFVPMLGPQVAGASIQLRF